MNQLIIGIIILGHTGFSYASTPLWTFSAPNPASITLAEGETGVVQYTITNQSRKPKNLVLQKTSGLNASPCYLGSQNATCNLILTINGSEVMVNKASTGPVLCEADAKGNPNPNQCYQPSANHVLNIRKNANLNLSIEDLALSVSGLTEYGIAGGLRSGVPRIITLTNTSTIPTTGITITGLNLPTDTTYTTSCGTTLANGASCTITIIPGLIASSDGTNPCTVTGTQALAGSIQVTADNAAPVSTKVTVLGYGCIYQDGYVFAFDDTTPISGSVGGKALSPTEVPSVLWSSNGSGVVTQDIIPWISEDLSSINASYDNAKTVYDSLYPNYLNFPFPASIQFSLCTGHTDGACNNANILALYETYITSSGDPILATGPTPPETYAAGACSISFDNHKDWYLPAICETGYDGNGSNSGCGTVNAPTLQNLQSNLSFLNLLSGIYWSSTESSLTPQAEAWYFNATTAEQAIVSKDNFLRVHCVRKLTY